MNPNIQREEDDLRNVEEYADVGNLIRITEEDMNAAGLAGHDMGSLTEEQINLLISIHEQRNRQSEMMLRVVPETGDVEVSDGFGFKYLFTQDELLKIGIDSSKLTDANIESLVSIAVNGVAPKEDAYQHPSTSMTPVMEQQEHHHYHQRRNVEVFRRREIGEEVTIDTGGVVNHGIVRFYKDQKYKVELADGNFQWVNSYQLRPKVKLPVSRTPVKRKIDPKPEPSVCCAVCDKQVPSSQLSFVVIRLPACGPCSKQKVMLLDGKS